MWTPIHPLTWLVPYVGHVGLAGRDGIVYDFAGRHVGRDAMAFGWPARYLPLEPTVSNDWEADVGRAAEAFERVEYNLLTWNCHSFLASFLNDVAYAPPSRPGSFRVLRCWTVAGVGLRIFVHGCYVHGKGGLMQQWGGSALVSWCVVWIGAWHGTWAPARAWAAAVLAANAFFVLWFGLLALLRTDSQRGSVPEDAVRQDDSDSDDEGLRTGL